MFLSYDRSLPVSVSFVRSSNTILSCFDVFYGSSSMSAGQLVSRCLRARLLLRDPDRYRTCVFSCRTHEIVCSLLRFGNLLWFPPGLPAPRVPSRVCGSRGNSSTATAAELGYLHTIGPPGPLH